MDAGTGAAAPARPAAMFFYMERCSRIRGEGTIRAPARANAGATVCAHGAAARDAARPAGDNSLPTVPKSGRVNHKNNQRERNDEGFSEQARCCAARRIGAGVAAACRRRPPRPIRRATSRRSSRSRPAMPTTSPRASCSSRSASSSASRSSSTTSGGAGGTIGVGQAARATPDGYTILFHSASFSASYVTHKTLPYDTFNDFIAVSAGRHFAERAGGRAVEGLQDRRRSDRRRQGQAGRD